VNIPAVSERSLRRDFTSSAVTITAEVPVPVDLAVFLNNMVHIGDCFG